jgi:hypothetical protein
MLAHRKDNPIPKARNMKERTDTMSKLSTKHSKTKSITITSEDSRIILFARCTQRVDNGYHSTVGGSGSDVVEKLWPTIINCTFQNS